MREREGKKRWRKILNRSSDGTYDRKQLKYDLIIIWDCHTWSYLWHSSHSPPLSRSRRLQPDTVDSANPKRINDFWTSKIPIEQIRLEEIDEKERESSSRWRKKRRARGSAHFWSKTFGRYSSTVDRRINFNPSAEFPRRDARAYCCFIVIPLLPNNFKSRDIFIIYVSCLLGWVK